MPVNNPTRDTRSRLADWIELQSLIKSRQVATRADFLSLCDLLDDNGRSFEIDPVTGEELETEILEDELSESAEEVLDELDFRAVVLNGYYPFKLEVRGHDWSLSPVSETGDPQIDAARLSYVFCLLTSAVRDGILPRDDSVALSGAIPDLFQAISAKAAGGVLGGEVVSFGWPRSDGSAFRQALEEACKRLRLGKPHDAAPLWSKGQEKDAGIDVIAWRDFADERPGKLVLFGQVASGNDWSNKTIENAIPRFFGWFAVPPTAHYIPAIFIPFPQHHDCTGRNNEPFERVATAEAWLREQQFGLVIDRLRLVGATAQAPSCPQETAEESVTGTLSEWISDALAVARARE